VAAIEDIASVQEMVTAKDPSVQDKEREDTIREDIQGCQQTQAIETDNPQQQDTTEIMEQETHQLNMRNITRILSSVRVPPTSWQQ
jgi:hypothetical protein